jgi:hypothetical protein
MGHTYKEMKYQGKKGGKVKDRKMLMRMTGTRGEKMRHREMMKRG